MCVGRLRPVAGRESGSVLVPALLAVSLLAGLCMCYMQLALSKNKESQISVDSKRAFYMAEAGLAEGYYGLARGKSGVVASESEPARLGNGIFWVTAEENGNRVTLRSNGLSGRGRASLSITLEKAQASVSALGVFADQQITLAKGALVDAWDSRAGEYVPPAGGLLLDLGGPSGAGARVGCNGGITLAGAAGLTSGARILGDAVPGPGGTVLLGIGALVSGSTTPANAGTDLPAFEVDLPADASALDVDASQQIGGAGSALSYGAVHVRAGATLTIRGPVDLALDSLLVESGGTLVIDGSLGNVHIGVRSWFDLLSGSALQTPGTSTERVLLAIAGGASVDHDGDGIEDPPVRLRGSGEFRGTFYAPGAAVGIPAGLPVFGALTAKSIALSANARVHFDRALLQAIAPGSLPELVCWRVVELPNSGLVRMGYDPLTVLRVNGVTPKAPAAAHFEVGGEPLGILRAWLAPVTNLLH